MLQVSCVKVLEMSHIDSGDQVSANQRLNHAWMGLNYCIWQSWEQKIEDKKNPGLPGSFLKAPIPLQSEQGTALPTGKGSSLKHLSRQLPGCAGGVGMRREGDWRLEGTLCPAKGVETAAMARASDGADPHGCLRDLPPLGRVTAAPKLKQ